MYWHHRWSSLRRREGSALGGVTQFVIPLLVWAAAGCSDKTGTSAGPTTPSPPQLASISVSAEGNKTSLMVGETVLLTATARDQNNAPFSDATFAWTSTNPNVATVDAQGLVTSVGSGQTSIAAAASGKQGSIQIGVSGSVHESNIVASQTWRAADNPHLVRGRITVAGPGTPKLTIEPGVIVNFAPAAALIVGAGGAGALSVDGSATAPVRFTSAATTPVAGDWLGISLEDETSSSSRIVNAIFEYCGGDYFGEHACIHVLAYSATSGPAVTMTGVTVRHSSGQGIRLTGGARFGAGSADVTVQNVASYPISIRAGFIGTLPVGGTFTANGVNMVDVETGQVSTSQTWPNLGIPYLMHSQNAIGGPNTPVVTIAAGTIVRFTADALLDVGSAGAGRLVVNGTAAAPVLFTADASSPAAGHWVGLAFGPAATGSSLDHAIIEYCGADSYFENACVTAIGGGSSGPVIRMSNVVIRQGSGHGVHMTDGGRFGAGSANVTVQDVANYPYAIEANYAGTLPTSVFLSNPINAVHLMMYEVSTTQTWPNLGVPYVISHEVRVSGLQAPVLTLVPGTELRFTPGGSLLVGSGRAGALQAQGTVAAPIVFTANAAVGTPGHWSGLTFSDASGGSLLDHVVIEFAGKDNYSGNANITVDDDIGPILRNSVIRHSSGCGVLRVNRPFSTDFTAPALGNTFAGNVAANQCGPF